MGAPGTVPTVDHLFSEDDQNIRTGQERLGLQDVNTIQIETHVSTRVQAGSQLVGTTA